MPEIIKKYVKAVDAFNRVIGLFSMYLIFIMMGILFYSSVSKTFFLPSLWTLEMAQFTMAAYYLLGGGYSMQKNSHVRMDLFYGDWKPKTKAFADSFTVITLIIYLLFLLYGAYSSTAYSIQYKEVSNSAWAPYLAPVKIVMAVGIFLMLLQAIAAFFRNVALATNREIS